MAGAAQSDALILIFNKQAMDYLRTENYQAALNLLTKAADLLKIPELPVKAKAMTLNNLGCYYKRTGRLKLALQYLQQALDLEVSTCADRTNLAGTHLNVCAINSTLGLHEVAIKHAYEAIELLKEAEPTANTAATIAIAYHNAGIEEEHLKNYERAANLYATGWKAASSKLGQSHALTVSLKESCQALSESKSKIGSGRTSREMKLPAIPKKKSFSKSFEGSYRKHNSKSVTTCRDITPDRVLVPLEIAKSAPTTTITPHHSRSGSSGRPPRSYKFTKSRGKEREAKHKAKKLPTLSAWKKIQYAAVTIQRHWKGFKVRQRMRLYRLYSEEQRLAQRAYDELQILKQEVMSGKRMMGLKNTIQLKKPSLAGKISGYARPGSRNLQKPLSPIMESTGEVKKERLRQVQAHIRGKLTRRTFNRKEEAAVVIQKHVRGRAVQMLYNKVLRAACVIQQHWRRLHVSN